MKEQFKSHRFKAVSREMIARAEVVVNEMKAAGYVLTIRQLYYQFVSRGWLENSDLNYKRLAKTIDNARQAGLIDWSAIEDRTRFLRQVTGYDGPQDFIQKHVENYYAEKLWRDQEVYAEVWVEKDALLGVVERPCNELRIPYLACRGYASSSELYLAGKRYARKIRDGKKCYLFHLGDHDPSGLDMTRVNEESIMLFSRHYGVEVRRLALNMDQVEQYNPPPNPAKESDSRFAEYAAEYGDESWELDALTPRVLDDLIRAAWESIIDRGKFDANLEAEREHQGALTEIADQWEDVMRYMKYRDVEAPHAQAYLTVNTILSEFEEGEGDDPEDD